MSIEESVEAFLQRRMERGRFIEALRAIGLTADAALGYALVLEASERRDSAAVGNIDPSGDSVLSGDLTADELQIVETIAARILPTTDTPGAAEAGAANYVRQALSDAYRPLLARYRRGLRQLDLYCSSTLGTPFVLSSVEQQDTVLADLASGKIGEVEGGAEFFQLVRRHVLEGMFCEPQYGGNRDLVGWRMVGFPGQRYGYADPYINRVVDLAPIAVDGPPRKDD